MLGASTAPHYELVVLGLSVNLLLARSAVYLVSLIVRVGRRFLLGATGVAPGMSPYMREIIELAKRRDRRRFLWDHFWTFVTGVFGKWLQLKMPSESPDFTPLDPLPVPGDMPPLVRPPHAFPSIRKMPNIIPGRGSLGGIIFVVGVALVMLFREGPWRW